MKKIYLVILFLFTIGITSTIGINKNIKFEENVRNIEIKTKNSISEKVEANYKSNNLIVDENVVSFSGELKENKSTYDFLDNISDVDVDNDNVIRINCNFDLTSMKYTLDILIYDDNCLLMDSFSISTDAIINSNGMLDAHVIIDEDNSFYISDYYSINSLDNCFLATLTTIIATLLPIGVAYVQVTESVEQKTADANLTYNRNLEKKNKGVGNGIYVTKQEQTSIDNRNAGNYRFGLTSFANVGCEVAAAYNLLIAVGKSERLSTTIYAFEKLAIEFSFALGNFGSNPLEIYRFLIIKGLKYDKYTNFDKFDQNLAFKRVGYSIMSRWNNPVSTGLHTFFVKKDRQDNYYAYNWEGTNSSAEKKDHLRDFNNGAGFIVGYIICL